jgi:hypothetical protein
MNEIINFNKLSNKCMELVFEISKIHNNNNKLLTEIKQETIDEIAVNIESFYNIAEEMKLSIMNFLNEIINQQEEIEINTLKTDFGYKI